MSRRKLTTKQRLIKQAKRFGVQMQKRLERSRAFVIMPLLTFGLIALWQFVIAPVTRLPYDKVSAQDGNMLQNGSFDTWSNRTPQGWKIAATPDSVLQYTQSQTIGHVDGSGLYVELGDYTSGSLQIISPTVEVNSGGTYFFKSIYKTDTHMAIFARVIDNKGKPTYQLLKDLPDYDYDWSSMSGAVTVGAHAAKLQIVMTLSNEGYAEFDSAYLVQTNNQAKTSKLLTSTQLDSQWSLYNNSQARVDAVSDGGTQVVNVKQYRDGNIGWKSAPQIVEANGYYETHFEYDADSPVEVWADFKSRDGKEINWLLAVLPATPYRTKYTLPLEAPTNAVQAQFSLQLSSDGVLKSTNVSFHKLAHPQKYNQPFVSVTFDDGWFSSKDNGVAILDEFGYKGTYYINPGYLGGPEYMANKDVLELKDQEHQIASHTNEHIDISSYDHNFIKRDIESADRYLSRIGVSNPDFASPYGKYDHSILPYIMSRYRSHRGTEFGVNTKQNFNPANLKGFFIRKETTDSQLRQALEMAQQSNGWLILIYHKIEPSDSPFDVDSETFKRHMKIVQESRIPVNTVSGVLGQL